MKKLFKKTLSILPVIALLFVTASTLLFAVACGKNEKTSENKNQLSSEDVESAQLFGLRQASVDGIDGYAINRYKGIDPVVTIPDTYRGKPILMLSEKAFYKQPIITVNLPAVLRKISAEAFRESSVISVTVPNNSWLTTIESNAFSDCTLLTSITIPASVKTMEDSVFSGCTSLQTVEFGEGCLIDAIRDSAFKSTSLTSITIPASVRTINTSSFQNCTSLQTVDFEEGSLLETIGTHFNDCTSLTTFTIPASVTTISAYAFQNCTSLQTVKLQEGFETVELDFFGAYDNVSRYSRLTKIIIPASVTIIGVQAFFRCTSLEEVIFAPGSQLKTIARSAFSSCKLLTSITIPAGVTTIGERAFSGCTSLTSITIPASVTGLGQYTFENCASLEEITIPASVETIGLKVFRYCTSLKEVIFEANSNLVTIAYGTFEGCTSLDTLTVYGDEDNVKLIYNKIRLVLPSIAGTTLQIDPSLVDAISLLNWNFSSITYYPE